MSEQSKAIVSAAPVPAIKRSGLLDGVRQLAYAWVGMWGVTSDDLGHFYQRCVARGEQALNARSTATQPAMVPRAPDVAIGQPLTPASRSIRPMSVFNAFGAVKSYHIDLNVEKALPTKEELDTLAERVEALAREVDLLVEQRRPEQ